MDGRMLFQQDIFILFFCFHGEWVSLGFVIGFVRCEEGN